MSGHSKWATIRRKKGAVDAKRGQVFTKIIREITVSARTGGGDPASNPRLRLAIGKAKAAAMPADNIQRAIKKGTGELEGVTYEECFYEGFGPGGTAVLIEVLTDNKNRTVSEIRRIFTKAGAKFGEGSSVAHLFEKKGLIVLDRSGVDEDRLMEVSLDAGADDVRDTGEDGTYEVVTTPSSFHAVKDSLEKASFKYGDAEIVMMPRDRVPVSGKDAEQLLKLIEALEEHDDVQKVHSNFDISQEDMEKVAAGVA